MLDFGFARGRCGRITAEKSSDAKLECPVCGNVEPVKGIKERMEEKYSKTSGECKVCKIDARGRKEGSSKD